MFTRSMGAQGAPSSSCSNMIRRRASGPRSSAAHRPPARAPTASRRALLIPFTLAPTSSADPNKWDRGLYRVAVAYSANSDATTDGQIAFSAGFTIS